MQVDGASHTKPRALTDAGFRYFLLNGVLRLLFNLLSKLSQPEEHATARGGKGEKLLRSVYGGRPHHIGPACRVQVVAIGLQNPARNIGAPNDLRSGAHAADGDGRCTGLLKRQVLGEETTAQAVTATR